MIKLKIGGLTFSSLSLGDKNLGSIQNSAPSIAIASIPTIPSLCNTSVVFSANMSGTVFYTPCNGIPTSMAVINGANFINVCVTVGSLVASTPGLVISNIVYSGTVCGDTTTSTSSTSTSSTTFPTTSTSTSTSTTTFPITTSSSTTTSSTTTSSSTTTFPTTTSSTTSPTTYNYQINNCAGGPSYTISTSSALSLVAVYKFYSVSAPFDTNACWTVSPSAIGGTFASPTFSYNDCSECGAATTTTSTSTSSTTFPTSTSSTTFPTSTSSTSSTTTTTMPITSTSSTTFPITSTSSTTFNPGTTSSTTMPMTTMTLPGG